jgi:hypothetical protein
MDHEAVEMPNSMRSRRSARSRAASGCRKPVKGTIAETPSRFDPLGVIDQRQNRMMMPPSLIMTTESGTFIILTTSAE